MRETTHFQKARTHVCGWNSQGTGTLEPPSAHILATKEGFPCGRHETESTVGLLQSLYIFLGKGYHAMRLCISQTHADNDGIAADRFRYNYIRRSGYLLDNWDRKWIYDSEQRGELAFLSLLGNRRCLLCNVMLPLATRCKMGHVYFTTFTSIEIYSIYRWTSYKPLYKSYTNILTLYLFLIHIYILYISCGLCLLQL